MISLANGYQLWSHTNNAGAADKLLCLHGGPGDTHEVYEEFGPRLKDLDIEVTMYDQLGSWYSETPNWDDPKIRAKFLKADYYVDEIEEVRQKLGYDNFYLAGHSWGGMIAMMYAHKYGQHLKGLIIISMIDNIPDYVTHIKAIRQREFSPAVNAFMDDIEKRGDFANSTYRTYIDHLYKEYVNRRQPERLAHLVDIQAKPVYNNFQGDNEFVIQGDLDNWDYSKELQKIQVPTLLAFADHETMPLETAQRMQREMSHARLVVTPNGGHNHMVDNPGVFFTNLRNYFVDMKKGTF
ncbi:proline iminopeptidase (pip) [Agrilactobacillus composti DSM 18527 = JCM 14202]|uniref:Proline iminopeptidase n=2 Tax=Agrilactobacillus TaxID=2767875 RepID=A0A0R1XUZ7_9LACO|nr:proline iminopeptidase (pip) [Agrilactobacillus composti DSM 18527 = JCM 14202]